MPPPVRSPCWRTPHDPLLQDPRCDSKLSGTTCCSVLLTAQDIICANVGDSRAIVGREDANGRLDAHALSWDQKPDVESEATRLISQFGPDVIAPVRDNNGDPCGPPRVWLGAKKFCGLSMTRCTMHVS